MQKGIMKEVTKRGNEQHNIIEDDIEIFSKEEQNMLEEETIKKILKVDDKHNFLTIEEVAGLEGEHKNEEKRIIRGH